MTRIGFTFSFFVLLLGCGQEPNTITTERANSAEVEKHLFEIGGGFVAIRLKGDPLSDRGSGYVVSRTGTRSPSRIKSLLSDAVGNIVAIGDSTVTSTWEDLTMIRFKSNGVFDTSFHSDGLKFSDYGSTEYGYGGMLQTDGKIIAFGGGGWGWERYLSGGEFDTSFHSDGKAPTLGSFQGVAGAALQTDGKMLGFLGGGGNFQVERLLASGVIDTSFATGGKANIDISGTDAAVAGGLQSDGKIIVFGADATQNFAFVRLLPSGALDASFGDSGIKNVDVSGGNYDVPLGILIQTDQKVLGVGYRSQIMAIVRLTAEGSLDASFHTDGIWSDVFFNSGSPTEYAYAAAQQTDGKIVVGGYEQGTVNGFILARFLDDGTVDTTFSSDGAAAPVILGDSGFALLLETSGKFIIGGSTNNQLSMVRVLTDGELDTSFFTSGKRRPLIGTNSSADSMVVDSTGKLVVGGWAKTSGNLEGLVIRRFSPNGLIDTSFSTDGEATVSYGNADNGAVLLQTDGRILALGSLQPGAVFRFLTDGVVDTSFNTAGFKEPTNSNCTTDAIVQTDGRIIVASYSFDFTLTRLSTDGVMDTSFNSNGIVGTNISGTDTVRTVFLQTDGKIIAIGDNDGHDFAAVRYLTNGLLDTTFHSDGKLSIISGGDDRANFAFLTADSKIVMGGSGSNDFKLVRVLTDGSYDTAFNSDGIFTINVSGDDSATAGSYLSGSNMVVIAGYDGTFPSRYAIARVTSSGNLDTTFKTGGLFSTSRAGTQDRIFAATSYQGAILGAGTTTTEDGQAIFILKVAP